MAPSAEHDEALGEAAERSPEVAAKARVVGCRRALGSLVAQLRDAAQGDPSAKAARAKAGGICEKIRVLAGEVDALADRFPGIAADAPLDLTPAREVIFRWQGGIIDAELYAALRPQFPVVEQDEHGIRSRRNYEEIPRDTDARKIIEAAGLTPWPPLTPKQEKIAAAQKREAENERRAVESLPTLPPGLLGLGNISL